MLNYIYIIDRKWSIRRPFRVLLACASVSKQVFVQVLLFWYENKFDLHENEPLDGTHSFIVSHLDSF